MRGFISHRFFIEVMFHNLEHVAFESDLLPSNPYGYVERPWMVAARQAILTRLAPSRENAIGRLIAIALVTDGNRLGFLAAHDQAQETDPWFIPNLYSRLPPLTQHAIDENFVGEAKALREIALADYEDFKARATQNKIQRQRLRAEGAPALALNTQSKRESMTLARLKSQYRERLAAENEAKAHLLAKIRFAQIEAWKERLSTLTLDNGKRRATAATILKEDLGHEHVLKAMLKTGLPSLLQEAAKENLRVLDWATFWWGPSPENDLRVEGVFCHFPKLRHEKLLKFYLEGRTLSHNIWAVDRYAGYVPEVLFEDDAVIAIDKPEGMLSVPGKFPIANAFDALKAMRPEIEGPVLLHRLDMRTSGILLFAKTKAAHAALAADFEAHRIEKYYEAILEAPVAKGSGVISLPLCQNPYDTPRQMVDYAYGRESVTRFKVLTKEIHPRVLFAPVTGRSHQIRIHAAHSKGLASPIMGDELYGNGQGRLMLHASKLTFIHPETRREITIESPVPF